MIVTIRESFIPFQKAPIISSKSYCHRYILAATLSKGKTVLKNIDLSVDVQATLDAAQTMGAKLTIQDKQITIEGIGGCLNLQNTVFDVKESGSTLRFLIPILATNEMPVTLVGKPSLFKRPLTVYADIFQQQKTPFQLKETQVNFQGKIKGGHYQIPGNVSSQFITGLLMALPLCQEDSTIEVIPPYESISYVSMTLDTLKKFGIDIVQKDSYTYFIKGNQMYHAGDFCVEGDYSQMSFFAALGVLHNGIQCENMNANSKQGDRVIIDFLKQMQADIDGFRFYKSKLKAISMSLADCPDLGPILMALATQVEGTCIFTNCERLRLKESDRIASMKEELLKLGCLIEEKDNHVLVTGPTVIQGGVELDGHNDHRIVMALSILSTIAKNPITIKGAEAVRKSYPQFFEDLKALKVQVKEEVK